MSSQSSEPCSWKSDVCTAELQPLSKEQQFRRQGELKETHAEDRSNVQVKMMTVLNIEL